MFKSIETIEGSDSSVNVNCIEFIILKESDSDWCVNRERILPEDEFENDKCRGVL